jgi:hypothetical protein
MGAGGISLLPATVKEANMSSEHTIIVYTQPG